MSNISFSVLLAPYRVEYFNYIFKYLDCENYFQRRNFSDHLFTEEQVNSRCIFVPKYVRCLKLWGGRRIVLNLKSIIKENHPKFIIAPEFSLLTFQLIFLKLFYRYKLIAKSDDSIDMIQHGGFSRIHSLSRSMCLPFLDDIILVDSRTTVWYQKKYNKGIWLPIVQDESKIKDTDKDRIKKLSIQYRKDYNIKDEKVVLFVGRLVDIKNVQTLIRACSKLTEPYRLVIVGDGEKKNEWERLANEISVKADFVGKKNGDGLNAWYYTADVFVLPSLKEAFGAVTNEAMLYGCNCVVSERAGSSCLVKEGVNGYTFDPDSINDLLNKLKLAFNMPQDNMRMSKMERSFNEYMTEAIERIKGVAII